MRSERSIQHAREANLKQYHSYIAHGLCPRCREQLPEGKTICARCSEIKAARHRETYASRVAQGLCVRCTNKAVEGKTLCPTCAQYLRDRYAQKKGRLANAV